jgi:hypothetical protein
MSIEIEARYRAIKARALAAASVEAGLAGRVGEADRCAVEHAEERVLAEAMNAMAGTNFATI